MRVLGIETSCDETGIAIYDDELGLLSHQLYSQVKLHADYGGVVPELASRDHIRKITPLIKQALAEANCDKDAMPSIASLSQLASANACLMSGVILRM